MVAPSFPPEESPERTTNSHGETFDRSAIKLAIVVRCRGPRGLRHSGLLASSLLWIHDGDEYLLLFGHTSGQSAIKVLSVSSRVDPRGSMNGEIQGISRVCVLANPFTCHLLCSEGNNGVGGCDMQDLFTLLARRVQWMLSTRAGRQEPHRQPNHRNT